MLTCVQASSSVCACAATQVAPGELLGAVRPGPLSAGGEDAHPCRASAHGVPSGQQGQVQGGWYV